MYFYPENKEQHDDDEDYNESEFEEERSNSITDFVDPTFEELLYTYIQVQVLPRV